MQALLGEGPSLVLDWMPPILSPVIITHEDDPAPVNDTPNPSNIPDTSDISNTLNVPDPFNNLHPLDSEHLIAGDELENGANTDNDNEVVETASANII